MRNHLIDFGSLNTWKISMRISMTNIWLKIGKVAMNPMIHEKKHVKLTSLVPIWFWLCGLIVVGGATFPWMVPGLHFYDLANPFQIWSKNYGWKRARGKHQVARSKGARRKKKRRKNAIKLQRGEGRNFRDRVDCVRAGFVRMLADLLASLLLLDR